MFFVEINLDVVLEVLLMVGLDFFSTKLVDRYHRKIFNFSTIEEEKKEF